MGFEHLSNDKEKFRNKVIEVNKTLYNLENPKWVLDPKERLYAYLKASDELNELYRVRPNSV